MHCRLKERPQEGEDDQLEDDELYVGEADDWIDEKSLGEIKEYKKHIKCIA